MLKRILIFEFIVKSLISCCMTNPEQWVENYGDYLFSIALLKTSSKETAEDIVQDTFVSAIRALSGFKGDSSEKTWLTKILNNKIIDYYRKKDVLKESDSYLIETDESFNNSFFESGNNHYGHWTRKAAPLKWANHADEKLSQNEFKKVLEFCVGKMPPKLVPVFLSKFIDDKNADEICKEFEISSSNYWVIIHRAKLLMRKCLETNWFQG